MKHKFSLEILLVTGFSFLFAPNLSVNAQTHALKRSGLTWDLGFGSGSYTGLGPRESGGITANVPGTNSFSKLAFAFRVLLGTNLLDSRLGVGFEYGGQQIGEGAESEYVYTEGPDPMIHLMLITGEYSVIKFSTKINIIAGGGLGMLFFANTATRREYDANTMLWKESEKSTAQFAGSGRLLVPLQVHPSFSIDPGIRFLASAGKEKVRLFQFLVGLTYRW